MSNLDRRSFVKCLTASGALLVGIPSLSASSAKAAPGAGGGQLALGLYVRIAPDGKIAIGAPSSEIGQGTWTSVSMLVAEELDVDFSDVEIEPMALTLREVEGRIRPATFTLGAGGSTAIAGSWEPARTAGAVARETLREAAARHWSISRDRVETSNAMLRDAAGGRQISYANAVALAEGIEIDPDTIELRPFDQMRIIGRPQGDKKALAIATGQPLFGIDQKIPGMVYAVIARAPRFDAEVSSVDDSQTLAVEGVLRTVRVKGPGAGGDYSQAPIANGVAVVADSLWAAILGRDKLQVEWTPGPMANLSSQDLSRDIDTAMAGVGQSIRRDGDPEAAISSAATQVEAQYELPIIAHAALEPPGFIADVRRDSCLLVGSTQDPWDCMAAARTLTGLDAQKVEVRNIRCGGGFGRRLDTDYAVEAILLSKELGRPVRVHWSREDDLKHDFYRPIVRHRIRGGLDSNGKLVGWYHKLASTARYFRRGVPPENYFIPEYWTDDMPARLVENMAVDYHFIETAIPFGPWRAPGHTANAFAVESFIDELAHAAGIDPLEFRLQLLGEPRELQYEQHGGPIYDTGRHAAVLRLAAERAGRPRPSGNGRGRGIASHFTFGTYVAHVVDVTVRPDGSLEVDRVVSAIDCGVVVNPSGATAQNEGGINDALSTALWQEITFTNGAVNQTNFDTYPMMRIDSAATNIETHFVPSVLDPSGMGEAPVPPFAPALANAIFAATGRRIRKLPIADQLLSWADNPDTNMSGV